MAIVDKLVYEKVVEQILSTARVAHYMIDYVIDAAGTQLKPHRLLYVDGMRDFQSNHSDEIMISVMISIGDLYRYVVPNKEDLKVTLTYTPLSDSAMTKHPMYLVWEHTYQAVVEITGDHQQQGGPSYSDDMGMVEVRLQLIPLAIWELRSMTMGGIFHEELTIDVLRTIIGHYSKTLPLDDKNFIKGVEWIEPSNKNVRENTVIPHNTYILDLPDYIQKYCGGIYNQGIGMYLHKRVWFIYPLYDNELYDKAEYPLDVFVMPKNRAVGTERSYQIKDNRLQILITGDMRQVDARDLIYLTAGNGVRFTQASEFFENYADVTGSKVECDVKRRVAQFNFRLRTKGDVQRIPFSPENTTDNIAYQMTRLARRVGETVQVKWENSRPDLLRPGMACKIFYPIQGGYEEKKGQLLCVEYSSQPAQPGLTNPNQRYITTSVLTLFIEKEPE